MPQPVIRKPITWNGGDTSVAIQNTSFFVNSDTIYVGDLRNFSIEFSVLSGTGHNGSDGDTGLLLVVGEAKPAITSLSPLAFTNGVLSIGSPGTTQLSVLVPSFGGNATTALGVMASAQYIKAQARNDGDQTKLITVTAVLTGEPL